MKFRKIPTKFYIAEKFLCKTKPQLAHTLSKSISILNCMRDENKRFGCNINSRNYIYLTDE